jgi:hypothetical protein
MKHCVMFTCMLALASILEGCALDAPQPQAIPAQSRAHREFTKALKDQQAREQEAIRGREVEEATAAADPSRVEAINRRIERLRELLGNPAAPGATAGGAMAGPGAGAAEAPAVAGAKPPGTAPVAREDGPAAKALTPPTTKAVATQPARWEVQVARDELRRLIAARESMDAHLSTEWHRHSAAAEVRMERLREMSVRLDLPREYLPTDDLALLERPTLENLKRRWSHNLEQLRRQAAEKPGESSGRRIQDATAKIRRIEKVLAEGPVDLVARFEKLPRAPKVSQDLVDWMNNDNAAALDARINLREQQLLKTTLARDASDLGARQRLIELLGDSPEGIRERLAQLRERLAIERFEGFRPGPSVAPEPNAPRSAIIKQMFVNRFQAPASAIQAEALLNQQWQELRAIGDPKVRAALLPESHGESVPRWIVSQMTNEDLAEAKLIAEQASEHLKTLDAEPLGEAERRSASNDRSIIAKEIEAIDAEFRYRESHGGRSSAPAVDPATLDEPTRRLLTAQADAKIADLEKTPQGKHALLAAEERYIARTDQPLPEVVASRNRHYMEGVEYEVDSLATDTRRYRELREAYTRRGFSGKPADAQAIDESFAKMKAELEARGTRIRQELKLTQTIDGEKSAALWKRVDHAMAETRGPPADLQPHIVRAADQRLIAELLRDEASEGWTRRPDGTPPPEPSGPDGRGPKRPPSGGPNGHGPDGPPHPSGPDSNGPGPDRPGPDRPGPKAPPSGGPRRPSGGRPEGPLAGEPGGNGPVRPSPAAPSGEANGPPTSRLRPYGDALIARSKVAFNREILNLGPRLQEATPPTTTVDRGAKPYVIVESADPAAVRLAPRGTRPDLKGWLKATRGNVRFQDINSLKSMKFIPGGVALGQVAQVEGNWADAGLVYDRADGRDGRLVFVKPSGERVKFPAVAPAVLKTCFLYARSQDPVAISIGYTGERSPLDRDPASQVLLHPELRDTQVGLDIINADRLPWTLNDEKLPNGQPNPVLAVMKDLVREARDPSAGMPTDALIERLREVASVAQNGTSPYRSENYRRALARLFDGDSRLDCLLRAILESPKADDRFQTFTRIEDEVLIKAYRAEVLAEVRKKHDLSVAQRLRIEREVKKADLEKLLDPEGLQKVREDQRRVKEFFEGLPADPYEALRTSLIILVSGMNNEVPWRFVTGTTLAVAATQPAADVSLRELGAQVLLLMKHAHLSLITDDPIRVKQVEAEMAFEGGLKIRYVHGKLVPGPKGLSRPDEVEESPRAGQKATELIPVLEKVYPPLKATGEYARYIALLRWALKEGNIAWLDLADLGPVDYRTRPTPDYILRGSRSNVQARLREFGLDESSN